MNIKSPHHLTFVKRIHRWQLDSSLTIEPVKRKKFRYPDVIIIKVLLTGFVVWEPGLTITVGNITVGLSGVSSVIKLSSSICF